MKIKRGICIGLVLCMLLGVLPLNVAFADSIDFDSRPQISYNDCSKGWGTVRLSDGKILKADEGKTISSLSENYSVFNQFRYYRGIDYYSGFSGGTKFAYDTTQSIYGAKLADNKYFYAVYTDSNDKNDYKVDFGAYFDSNLRKIIANGDLEVGIVAETNNYKGDTNHQTGVANLRFYNSSSPNIQQEITTQTNKHSGVRTVWADWIKVNKDTTKMIMNLRSERNKFTRKFNKSYVTKVRVFLRDAAGPKVDSCKISSGDFTTRKNSNNEDVLTANAGSKIVYEVKFTENVKVIDTSNLKLRISAMNSENSKNPGSDATDNANFDATYLETDNDKIYFQLTVPDNTNSSYELKVKAAASKLVNGKTCITDIAGNALTEDTFTFTQKASSPIHTVDDTKTGFYKYAFTDSKYMPYPTVSNNSTNLQKVAVYNTYPSEIYTSGQSYSQPTVFSKNSKNYPIFRITLNDEIQKSYLNENTKLKLRAYDLNGNVIPNVDIYANLVHANIVNVTSGMETRGIKSDAYSELYFKYTPVDINGYPEYKINFAGEVKNGYFVFDGDAIKCGDSKLYNISNMEVDCTNLKVPSDKLGLVPFNLAITIDNDPPKLISNGVKNDWAKSFDSDSKLVFNDSVGFGTEGAKIEIVYYETKNDKEEKKTFVTSMEGKNKTSAVKLPAILSRADGKYQASVDLSLIGLSDSYLTKDKLYLEYSIADKAGNIATNAGQKDIRLYLDNAPPVAEGASVRNENGTAYVQYKVKDTGVGRIDSKIRYILENFTDNETNEYTRVDSSKTIPVTGIQGKFDKWQVAAYFSDTLGNEMKEPKKSPVFSTALRSFLLSLDDTAESVVAHNHKITANTLSLPTDNATFNVRYAWNKGSSPAKLANAGLKKSFANAEELKSFDFAQESIQKIYNRNLMFDGEWTLTMDVVMLPDDAVQHHTQTFYFDRTSPSGLVSLSGSRDGVNTSYDVVYDLYDDASEYKNGVYVTENNIDFSEGNAPELKVYIDEKLVDTHILKTFKSSQTIDFKSEYGDNPEYENASKVKVEISFKDKFGNSKVIESEEQAIDFKEPEILDIKVLPSDFVKRDDNTFIINSLNDIQSISATFADNAMDKLDVYHGRSYNPVRLQPDSEGKYTFTAKNLIDSDFDSNYNGSYITRDYNFRIRDMGDNFDSKSISFIIDYYTPSFYYTDLSILSKMTNEEFIEIPLMYAYDNYETSDDITITASGAEVIKSDAPGYLTLKITENGTVSVTTRDLLGKTDTKTFEVNCFDRNAPTIELDPDSEKKVPEEGPVKYGSLTFTANDNDSLKVLSVAITTGEPSEYDFFSQTAEMKIVSENNGEEVYSGVGYFGENSDDAFAKLTSINPISPKGNVSAGYKLTYGAIPDGRYGIYAKVADNSGNETVVKLTEIETTSEPARSDTTYTPSSDTVTGGDVTAVVKTDILTQLLYGEGDDNIESMFENAAKMRENGYTYFVYDEASGSTVTKTLSFAEAIAKYREIAEKYFSDESSLTAEEKLLVKYKPDFSQDSYDRYENYLSSDTYSEPMGDLLDYLINQCLCGVNAFSEKQYVDVDENASFEVTFRNLTEDDYKNVINPLMYSGVMKETAESITGNELVPPPTPGNGGIYSFCLSTYPERFDSFAFEIDKESLVEGTYPSVTSIDNPFGEKTLVSRDEIYQVFDSEFDLSTLTPGGDDGSMYENPFSEFTLEVSEIDESLRAHMTEYIDDHTKYYKNPFVENSGFTGDDDGLAGAAEELTYTEILKVVNAIFSMQSLREKTVEYAADKYVRSYMVSSGSVFSKEHIMTFQNNVERNYVLMDESGRKTELPISISWIDHTIPYVPRENIVLSINGTPFTAKFTNADSGTLTVELPSEGIFNEYRIANIPEGAVGTSVGETTDGTTLYSSFTLDVYDNGTIAFDVLNPTASETEFARQTYTINCFDRVAPTYELYYSPQKPSNGANVNTDVTVTLSDIEDNASALNAISVSSQSHTFTENGSYDFTLTDEAGNETVVTATVDYIDKSPVDLDVEFKTGEQSMDISNFTVLKNTADYKNVSAVYDYNGPYIKNDVTATIKFRGNQLHLIAISDNGEYTYTYTSNSGSKGTVTIRGIKFDKEPPKADVEYEYIEATASSKDSVRADITLSDNVSSTVSLVSVSGRDNDGKAFTAADVTQNADGTRSVLFKNNGFATLTFVDASGNTTELSLSVTNLDRTAPRAFISYSTEKPTNSDVVANISLNKLVDYQIYGSGNSTVPEKDYSGAYSNYITYTFEQNGTKVFKFRDTSGNETEGLLASVSNIDKDKPSLSARVEYNKMVTESGTLEYYPGAATIILEATSPNDVFIGGEGDTIFIQNAAQTPYHTVMTNGQYTFKYMDTAGNFDVVYVDVNIDRTAPTATVSGNPTEWVNTAPSITVTANQKSSGIKSYIYQNGMKQTSTTFNPTENGTYTFTVTDEIGNSATEKVVVDHVDMVSPEFTINTENVYEGNRDIYIKYGEFNQTAFEDVTATDEASGLAEAAPRIDYGEFDATVPGKYPVYFKISDVAGNETTLTRNILVMGPDDVFAAINGQLIVPNSQVNYILGQTLKLSFVNAETAGNKVSYAFVKGYYNGAQMKGKNFKALVSPDEVITLEASETGMYTLFMQTENRNVMVMYVFIAG